EKAGYDFFEKELHNHLMGQMSFDFMDKKEINEYNFVEVYDYWAEIFGDDVKNGTKPSKEDKKDRFVASWLSNIKLTKEAQKILDIGKEIYKLYFKNFNKLATSQFKIEW